jgi:hypothetical protein
MSHILCVFSHATQPFLNTQHTITTPKRIRPQRVAARRQRELMVIIANEENEESVDWMDEEDLNGISIPQDEEILSLHIYFMKKHFNSPIRENGESYFFFSKKLFFLAFLGSVMENGSKG